jgi:dephospho-CoA kinase
MISIGLTGGIGSGKTKVAELFSVLNVPIYNSDLQANILMETNPLIHQQIIDLLGEEAYVGNKINKPFVSKKIFSDPSLKNSLNKIVHNKVLEDFIEWKEINSSFKYIIQEAAILFETDHYKIHDIMITVTCPIEIKMDRLKKRGLTESEIMSRIKNQWSDEKKVPLSDYIIINDEKESLIQQVIAIHEKLINS